MSEALKYIVAFGVSILAGVVIHYFVSLDTAYVVSISIAVFVILAIISLYLSLRGRWIHLKVQPHIAGSAKQHEIGLISKAKRDVKILGISMRSFWANPDFIDTVVQAGKNVKFTFLILDPSSSNLARKAEDEGADADVWKSNIDDSVLQFRQLCRMHPTKKLESSTYDAFPIWHMCIIDDEDGLIGYYPTGKAGGTSPLYAISDGGDLSLLTPFLKYFDEVRLSGKRITLTAMTGGEPAASENA